MLITNCTPFKEFWHGFKTKIFPGQTEKVQKNKFHMPSREPNAIVVLNILVSRIYMKPMNDNLKVLSYFQKTLQ